MLCFALVRWTSALENEFCLGPTLGFSIVPMRPRGDVQRLVTYLPRFNRVRVTGGVWARGAASCILQVMKRGTLYMGEW